VLTLAQLVGTVVKRRTAGPADHKLGIGLVARINVCSPQRWISRILTVALVIPSLAVYRAITSLCALIVLLLPTILPLPSIIPLLPAVVLLLAILLTVRASAILLPWLERLCAGLKRCSARLEGRRTRLEVALPLLVSDVHLLLRLPRQVLVLCRGIVFPRIEVRHDSGCGRENVYLVMFGGSKSAGVVKVTPTF
jgi:hypothetical protein